MGALLGVDLREGRLLWQRPVDGRRPWASNVPVSRGEMIQRARRGLPIPAMQGTMLRARVDSFDCGPAAACLLGPGGVTAWDPFDGERLLHRPRARQGELRRALVAVGPGEVCVAVQRPARLLLFDPVDGALRAEWRFDGSPRLRCLSVTEDRLAVLADYRRLYVLDLETMGPLAVRRMAGGVDEVLYADRDLVVLRSLDGRTVGVRLRNGHDAFEVAADGMPRVLWARRLGETLFLLEAGRLKSILPRGADLHHLGSEFVFRAVRSADGAPMWRFALPRGPEQLVGTPLVAGGLWLLPSGVAGRAEVLGLDARTGQKVFAVDLAAEGEAAPVSVAVSAGRLVVNAGRKVSALRAGPRRLEDARSDAGGGP
jgi:hypothetical protein